MSRRLNFGIEEEYFLTDLVTRRMPGQPDAQAIEACRAALGQSFAYEMFQGQIEVASPVFSSLPDAADYLATTRSALRRALEPFGLGLLSAGSHPLADWRIQQPTDQAHFHQLFDDYQRVARRSVLSGLHVHVEVPGHLDRIRVMNEVLPWVPLLLALSTSSPFWEGEDSGFMSYRQVACDEWPRMGIPEFFEDQDAFDDYVALMTRTGSIRQPSDCWWSVRPAARFPTLELRITDACPRLDEALCIASLFRLMVADAITQPLPGTKFTRAAYWVLKENRWRAKRYGIHGTFIGKDHEPTISVEQWLTLAQATFAETAQQLGVQDVFKQARRMLIEGTSADRQRYTVEQALRDGRSMPEALARAVDQLLMETGEQPCASPAPQRSYDTKFK